VHEKICEAIALSLAKAAAIRPGKSLSLEEMDHLIASLIERKHTRYGNLYQVVPLTLHTFHRI